MPRIRDGGVFEVFWGLSLSKAGRVKVQGSGGYSPFWRGLGGGILMILVDNLLKFAWLFTTLKFCFLGLS